MTVAVCESFQQKVENILKVTTELPIYLKTFSESISSRESSDLCKTIQQQTVKDSIIYIHCILPKFQKMISDYRSLFGYYEMPFDRWTLSFDIIKAEAKEYKCCALEMLLIHSNISIVLNKRAAAVTNQMILQHEKKYEKSQNYIQRKSESCGTMGRVLGFLKKVVPTLKIEPDFNDDDDENVYTIIDTKPIQSSLSYFLNGMEELSIFLIYYYGELVFLSKEWGKYKHHEIISKFASVFIQRCDATLAILPGFITDITSMPNIDWKLIEDELNGDNEKKTKGNGEFAPLTNKNVIPTSSNENVVPNDGEINSEPFGNMIIEGKEILTNEGINEVGTEENEEWVNC